MVTIDDAQIGKNLAKLRGERSQKDIADAMRALGFKWSQAAVWNVERGERPLRATELVALENVLGKFRMDLLADSEAAQLNEIGRRIAESYQRIQSATKEYDESRFLLGITADKAGSIPGSTTRFLSWLDVTAEEVVREVHREEARGAEEAPAEYLANMGPYERRVRAADEAEAEMSRSDASSSDG